jgi:hypothetical protein
MDISQEGCEATPWDRCALISLDHIPFAERDNLILICKLCHNIRSSNNGSSINMMTKSNHGYQHLAEEEWFPDISNTKFF